MSSKKIKWLIYTVLVGLIPFVIRLLIFVIAAKATSSFLLNASDFVSFGLVLHISNINELEHSKCEKDWKTIQNGIQIIFIVFYGVLFSCTLIDVINPGVINIRAITYASMAFSAVSLLLSYSIYDRLSKKLIGRKL